MGDEFWPDPYPNPDPLTQLSLDPDTKHWFEEYEENFFVRKVHLVLDTISCNKYGIGN